MSRLIVFDGDDTLWRVEHLYDEARDAAGAIVREAGYDPDRWAELQRVIDVANVAAFGLSRERFPLSSVQAYERLVSEAGGSADEAIQARVRQAAATVFVRHAPLMPNVRSVLETLGRSHRLALLTQGDPAVQRMRIDDSRLRNLFEFVHIVERKDADSFGAVLNDAGVSADHSWSVGNSIPSDINPALRIGMSAIWIEAPVWKYEWREESIVAGRCVISGSLEEVPAVIEEHLGLVR